MVFGAPLMPCHARRPLFTATVVLAGLLPLVGGVAQAELRPTDLRPTWECLPADTAVMVRLPDAAAFLDTIRSKTRFGSVVLEPKRLWNLFKAVGDGLADADGQGADGEGADDNLDETLAKYGLTPADLTAGLAGDTGMAMLVQSRGAGRPPLVMTLGWTEPGPDTAMKLLTAVQTWIEEDPVAATRDRGNRDRGQEPPKRVDLSLAGHDVMWLSQPIMRADLGDLKIDQPIDPAGLQALRKELAERAKTAPQVKAGQINTFVARLDGRLLAVQTTIPEDADAGEAADAARETFARLLADHAASSSSAAAPLAELFQPAAVRAVLPEGQVLADIVVDPRPLLQAVIADTDEARRRLRAVGLDDIGPLVWRHAFAAGCFRQGLFLGLPAPRHGLARILDQECDAAEVPPFATNDVADVTQISLDLGKAYATVREFATAEGGEQAANMFNVGEMQTQGWLGIDLPGLLTALGSRHWIVSYPTVVTAALAEARKTRTDAGLQAMPGGDRMALVWQLVDEAPFVKLLQRLAPLVGGEIRDEQGFQALRLPANAAVFVGRNHAVVTLGEETAEATLAAIRTPPAGNAALRESVAVRRAGELLALRPARVFSVGDATRTGGTLGSLCELAASLEPADVAPAYRSMLATVQKLLPSAADMEGVFGASGLIVEVIPDGITFRSAWEMPAP
jgi:hypothetical protein